MDGQAKHRNPRWLALIAGLLVWTSADGDRQAGRKPRPAPPTACRAAARARPAPPASPDSLACR